MTVTKALATLSVLWSVTANSEAPFLSEQPTRPSIGPAAAAAGTSAARAGAEASAATTGTAGAALRVPQPTLMGVHVTGSVWQIPGRLDEFVAMSRKRGLTAIVLEIKDDRGELFFKSTGPDGTNRLASAVKRCHGAGLQVIARYCVFKDVKAEEEIVEARFGSSPGSDARCEDWTDPVAPEALRYNLDNLREVVACGVDEVNLDYVRYPSAREGQVDLPLAAKCRNITEFIRKARRATRGVRLSLDVFGYVAWSEGAARVGQKIEDLAPWVDGIYPMLYPNHFAQNSLGYKHPVEHPYTVLRRGCEAALSKKGLAAVRIIPWIQCFSLRKDTLKYGPVEVLAQIQGAKDSGIPSFLAWNSQATYDTLDRALGLVTARANARSLVAKYIPLGTAAPRRPASGAAPARVPAAAIGVPSTASPTPGSVAGPSSLPARGRDRSGSGPEGPAGGPWPPSGQDGRPAPRLIQPLSTAPGAVATGAAVRASDPGTAAPPPPTPAPPPAAAAAAAAAGSSASPAPAATGIRLPLVARPFDVRLASPSPTAALASPEGSQTSSPSPAAASVTSSGSVPAVAPPRAGPGPVPVLVGAAPAPAPARPPSASPAAGGTPPSPAAARRRAVRGPRAPAGRTGASGAGRGDSEPAGELDRQLYRYGR
jgi:hypothetical protein